eukprot:8060995-Alexandrium_andersonii.AAC.1
MMHVSKSTCCCLACGGSPGGQLSAKVWTAVSTTVAETSAAAEAGGTGGDHKQSRTPAGVDGVCASLLV